MMHAIRLFLSKLARATKTRSAFLGRIVGPDLGLALLAGTLLAIAYVVVTRSVLALEFSQKPFEFIP
jgi:hypothetical protein